MTIQYILEEHPFTKLFSLLKKDNDSFNPLPLSKEKLQIIREYSDIAINMLVNGLKDVAELVIIQKETLLKERFSNLSYFISGTDNLTKALKDIRTYIDDILKKID